MKISLCLLTFNEIDGCKHDVLKINKIKNFFDEVYAIDGGSTDGTVLFLNKQKIKVYKQPLPGLNQAFHFGMKKSKADAVVFFHPKGTIPVNDILKFKKFFEDGYDFVIGSRIIRGSQNEEDLRILKPRKWFVILLAIATFFLFGNRNKIIWDVLHGFRGISKKGYKKMHLKDVGMVTIDIEMVVRSYKNKIKTIEFPTKETKRIGGKTHFKAVPTGLNILKYIKREILRGD